jgi:hypothetical protein
MALTDAGSLPLGERITCAQCILKIPYCIDLVTRSKPCGDHLLGGMAIVYVKSRW